MVARTFQPQFCVLTGNEANLRVPVRPLSWLEMKAGSVATLRMTPGAEEEEAGKPITPTRYANYHIARDTLLLHLILSAFSSSSDR